MFAIVTTSKAQLLNMVKREIVSQMSHFLEMEDGRYNVILSNLLYNKTILDEHVECLKENVASIEN